MGLNLEYFDGRTPLDEDEKEGLKIKSITTHGELNEFEQLNIEKALEWSIQSRLKPEKYLSESFIKELHKRMFGDVWKWAGKYRNSDKNLGVTWTRIPIDLKVLFDDTNYWINQNTHSPAEIAIRFKHRLVSIHCFPNGNGRHSRIMADLIMEKIFRKDIFNWHRSAMVKANETRKKYIAALKEADKGNIQDLIEFAKE